ncbi:MAG: hypothetical protein LAQ30_20425 [Acidobacteriia bacterium]|nr:hypothetical protein [Terriglobia bacterium]
MGAGGGIAQQVLQGLLAGQGVEEFLIVERGLEQRLLLVGRERAGGVSAQ